MRIDCCERRALMSTRGPNHLTRAATITIAGMATPTASPATSQLLSTTLPTLLDTLAGNERGEEKYLHHHEMEQTSPLLTYS